MAYAGYAEVLPSPFIANDTFDVWGLDADDDRRRTVSVQNPLESDKAILSTTPVSYTHLTLPTILRV